MIGSLLSAHESFLPRFDFFSESYIELLTDEERAGILRASWTFRSTT